ncbi:hypothetical protein [Caulifigura coniformis]|nr:hypothetical protein [Caulifigura coniformis]
MPILAVLLTAAGCASRGNTELLEANLRHHEDRVAAFERQVSNLQGELASARAEADQLRRELVALGKDGRQEVTEPLSRVAGIQFNSLMTGGRDADGEPGHDVITAVLAPHDKDGDLVKLGGELEIEVLDLTRSGEDRHLGRWKFTADQARELWHSGFLASGYQLDLPVGKAPREGEVILHGRLLTADGRQFDTMCPVTLAATATSGTPGGFTAPASTRPVSATTPADDNVRTGKQEVVTASAEFLETRAERPVEKAGFAKIAAADPVSGPTRPVPPPVDVPAAGRSTDGSSEEAPRPFPGTAVQPDAGAPRPFPATTSDNWTDETIPRLR